MIRLALAVLLAVPLAASAIGLRSVEALDARARAESGLAHKPGSSFADASAAAAASHELVSSKAARAIAADAALGSAGEPVSIASAVPEPESFVLLLAGLGAIGWVVAGRRHRS